MPEARLARTRKTLPEGYVYQPPQRARGMLNLSVTFCPGRFGRPHAWFVDRYRSAVVCRDCDEAVAMQHEGGVS
jgi:hypothetical protein